MDMIAQGLGASALAAADAAAARVEAAGVGPKAQMLSFRKTRQSLVDGISGTAATLGNSLYAGVFGISFATNALIRSPGLTMIYNGGVAGETSLQIRARVPDIPISAEYVFFGEGPNDQGAGVTPQQHYANLYGIGQDLLNRGHTPVLITSSPRNTKSVEIGNYVAADMLAAADLGIDCLDPWSLDIATGGWSGSVPDPVHADFTRLQESADNLVASIAGTRKASFAPRANIYGSAPYCLNGGNGLMLNASAQNSGVPEGWVLAGSATPSIVAAPAGFKGNFLKLTGAGTSGNPYVRRFITSGWSVGDELLATFVVEGTNLGDANRNVTLDAKADGVALLPLYANVSQSFAAQRMHIRIKPTTLTQLEFYIRLNGAATGHSISIGEFEVYNLTKLRGL